MNFTAKVIVQGNQPNGVGTNSLNFVPDYNDERNKEWSEWTPALHLSMTVKEELGQKINIGQAYTLTFEESE